MTRKKTFETWMARASNWRKMATSFKCSDKKVQRDVRRAAKKKADWCEWMARPFMA